jgi:hypothetical protein
MDSKKDVSQVINDTLRKIPFGFRRAAELYKAGIRFYKGSNIDEKYVIQYARHRKSIGKSNLHTLLLSEILPSWKSYPKRNHCIIFALSKEVASSYVKKGGALYSVFPSDDALLGIALVPNIWDAFGIPLQELNKFLSCLNDRTLGVNVEETQEFKNFLTFLHGKNIEDGKVLEKDIETILEESPGTFPNSGKIREFATKMLASGNCTAYLDDYLEPSKNGFDRKKISDDLDFLVGKDYEVWTEQACLFIRTDIVE